MFDDFSICIGNINISYLHHQISFTRNHENALITDLYWFVRALKYIRFDGVLKFETAYVLTVFPKEMKVYVMRIIARIR